MISSNNLFKNTILSYIKKENKNKLKLLDKEENSINENNFSENENDNVKIYKRDNSIDKKERIFSTRNPRFYKKLNMNIKSATIKTPDKNKIFLPFKLKKDKMSNTGISFYRNNSKNTERIYSSYYIKSDLLLDKQYLSDFLIKDNEIKDENSKISEIEQKINKLGKSLNLYLPKNHELYPLGRPFSSFPKSQNIKKKINFKLCNHIIVNEEEKNKNTIKNSLELPDYLKEEFKIKGTSVLSPFCTKARDNFKLKKFIRDFNNKNNLKSDKKYINNKLNIIYAENEEVYNKKLSILNKKLIKKGKIDKCHIRFSPSEKLLREMEKKVTFMKNIVEYAYPNTTLMRLRIPESKKYFKKYKYKYDFKNFESNKEKLNEVHSQIYRLSNNTNRINSHRRIKSKTILYK